MRRHFLHRLMIMKYNLTVNPKLTWIPALDGLRGIAVIAVMLFHMPARDWFPGGYLGVDLFFVLSGFLITTLLLQEHVATGQISLRGFYVRRIRRLLPALLILLAVFAVVTPFLSPEVTGRAGPELILVTCVVALAYSVNLFQMFGLNVAPGMSHLWSLGVEEQFYLMWPALLFLGLKLRLSPLLLTGLTAVLAVGSAALPFLVEGSHGRFYNGPDFRAQELLAGALAAHLYVGGILNRDLVNGKPFKAGACLAVVVMTFWLLTLRDIPPFLFDGYYAVVAVCCVLFVCYAAFSNSFLLTNWVLCYLGRRSYALYLWHMPLNRWLRDLEVVPQLLVVFVLSIMAAELSFRLVESRFQVKRSAPSAPGLPQPVAPFPARAA